MTIQSYIVIALIVALIGIPSFLFAKKRKGGNSLCLGVGLPKEAPISLLFAEVIDNMERYSSVSKCPKSFKCVWAALTEKKCMRRM